MHFLIALDLLVVLLRNCYCPGSIIWISGQDVWILVWLSVFHNCYCPGFYGEGVQVRNDWKAKYLTGLHKVLNSL